MPIKLNSYYWRYVDYNGNNLLFGKYGKFVPRSAGNIGSGILKKKENLHCLVETSFVKEGATFV